MVIAQLFHGQHLDSLSSLGVIALNIGLKIRRELRIQKKTRRIRTGCTAQGKSDPQRQVSQYRSQRIVTGEMLQAEPGDRIILDGEFVIHAGLLHSRRFVAWF